MTTSCQFWPVFLVQLYNICNWHSSFNHTNEALFLDLNIHSDASSKIWWSLLHPKLKWSAKPKDPLKPIKNLNSFYSVSGKYRLRHRTSGTANWVSNKTFSPNRQVELYLPQLTSLDFIISLVMSCSSYTCCQEVWHYKYLSYLLVATKAMIWFCDINLIICSPCVLWF